MGNQSRTSRRSVMMAAIALVLAASVLGAAYLTLDGARVLSDMWSGLADATPSEPPVSAQDPGPPESQGLDLPPGMSEEFALRLWQEQLDSQRVITQLVDGEVRSLRISGVERAGDEARLLSTMTLKDGSTVPGVIGMRAIGGVWYVAYASAQSDSAAAVAPTSELPTVDEVDTDMLNTIIAEQTDSAKVTQEYVDGKIEAVSVKTVTMGPNTATITLEMNEDHEEGYADIVAVKQSVDGEDMWFLARFDKTLTASGQ